MTILRKNLLLCFALGFCLSAIPLSGNAQEKPNVIFILADDLGYGDIGCYGQKLIQTPRIDAMAADGMKFTNFYAGSTVCAPSRCVLMTGQHTGRCWVRGNAGDDKTAQTLRPEDVTVAEIFKDAGYKTALIGKWGLGEEGTPGHPIRQGFDYFFGYLNQGHAHNFYPEFLFRGEEKVPLRNKEAPESIERRKESGKGDNGSGWASVRKDYSHDLFADEALEWLEQAAGEPFFLYLALTIPHANNEGTRGTGDGQDVPDHGIYADKDWPNPDKGQAAMITRMDKDIGRILDFLKEKGVAENTLVIFTADNGPHKEGGNRPDFFDANGPLKGIKRDLYEGGIRVPTIAWWPGRIDAGSVSDRIAYFGDFMATACELTGQPVPANTQSISFLPSLLGRENKAEHEYLYWEFFEQGGRRAVRFGNWKAIQQPGFDGKIELYDLSKDLGEENNIAAEHPDVVTKTQGFMDAAHVDDPKWQVRGKK